MEQLSTCASKVLPLGRCRLQILCFSEYRLFPSYIARTSPHCRVSLAEQIVDHRMQASISPGFG